MKINLNSSQPFKMNKADSNANQLDYINNLINKIYPLILITIGTIGNSFIFYIFTRNQFIKQSTCFYFAFSAVVDTFLLYFGLLKHFIGAMVDIDIRDLSNFNCKFFIYIVYVLQQLSAWTLILISLDRLIVTFSTKFGKKLIGRKYQYFFVIFLLFFFLISNFHIIINCKLINRKENGTGQCGGELKYNVSLAITDLFLSVLIPFFVTFSSNIILLAKIYKSKNKVFDKQKSLIKTTNYAITIIGKNFVFLVLNIPICVILIKVNINDDFGTSLDILIYSLSSLLSYSNLSFNFFLFLAINGIFRRRFIKIFTLKQNSISSTYFT